jgi:hypothetical protein
VQTARLAAPSRAQFNVGASFGEHPFDHALEQKALREATRHVTENPEAGPYREVWLRFRQRIRTLEVCDRCVLLPVAGLLRAARDIWRLQRSFLSR